ncbi:MAG TPA: DUF58 domain-containing protein [Patescibacteria group bacterium]|nr:DUF58 domain-containing protein [Patescibacteria group bacterium]
MTLAFKVLYRSYRAIAGVRYWGYRRLTRAGLTVLSGLVLATIASPDTDNSVAYQGFSFLLLLLLLACCSSFFFRARFSAKRMLPRFGTVGAPLKYTVALQNLTSKTQTGLCILENLADSRPSFQDWLAVQLAYEQRARSFRFSQNKRSNPFRLAHLGIASVPPARSKQEVQVQCQLTPLRRGVLRLESLGIARPDPLGLFRAFTEVPLAQNVLILPKRYPLPLIELPGTMKYQQGGIALASNVGQSDEFVALRDYRQGDPLRHIHWRSWARAGKPVVKEFEDEFFVRHALVLDTFTGHAHTEAFEEATSIAASFACTIQTQESLLDLLFVGQDSYCFTAGRGVAHGEQLLEVLASIRPARERSFETLERLVLNHISKVSGCIFVLLGWDEQRREFVRKVQASGVPLLVMVVVESDRVKLLSNNLGADRPERFYILECGKIEQGLAQLK